jgi:hypothetical protein
MNARPDRSDADQTALERAWGREAARLLALLREKRHSGVTVETMRQRGIDAPAQAIYTLQLAGYTIDRVSGSASGHRTPMFRLRGGQGDLNGRSPPPEGGGDHET